MESSLGQCHAKPSLSRARTCQLRHRPVKPLHFCAEMRRRACVPQRQRQLARPPPPREPAPILWETGALTLPSYPRLKLRTRRRIRMITRGLSISGWRRRTPATASPAPWQPPSKNLFGRSAPVEVRLEKPLKPLRALRARRSSLRKTAKTSSGATRP